MKRGSLQHLQKCAAESGVSQNKDSKPTKKKVLDQHYCVFIGVKNKNGFLDLCHG